MCKTGKRILIIEDTDSIALLMKANLRHEGYVTEVAGTIKAGLECFKTAAKGPVPFDLVLLDVNLPDGDGLSVLRQLSPQEDCPPIFVLSADGAALAREKARDAGAVLFFEKPIDFFVLKHAIQEQIGGRKLQQHSAHNVDIEAEKKILRNSYREHLLCVAEQLQECMSYNALTSLLHQLKGSANLYGLTQLSDLSAALGEQLVSLGPKVANEVKVVLRQEIIIDVRNNDVFAS